VYSDVANKRMMSASHLGSSSRNMNICCSSIRKVSWHTQNSDERRPGYICMPKNGIRTMSFQGELDDVANAVNTKIRVLFFPRGRDENYNHMWSKKS
jgi:hypothetical protein